MTTSRLTLPVRHAGFALFHGRILLLEAAAATLIYALLLQNLAQFAAAPKLNSDSGTALTISLALSHGDPSPLLATLSPPIQVGTYAVLLRFGWGDAISAMPILLSLALALSLSWIEFRVTKSSIGAAAPLILLLFSRIFWEQLGVLTFYPAFAALGYVGFYLSARYLFEDTPWIRVAILAGLLLAMALYAFTTALLFLPVPLLMCLCYFSKERLRRLVHLYAFIGLFSIPWFAWHVWLGGTHFYYHPLNWSNEEMLPIVNSQFWHYPKESLLGYAGRMAPVGYGGLLPAGLWPFFILGLVRVWQVYGPRAVGFTCIVALFFVANIAFVRPSPFTRYFFPIFPLVILVGAYGIVTLWERMTGLMTVRYVVASVVVAAASLALDLNLQPNAVQVNRAHIVDRLDSSATYVDMQAIAKLVVDKKGIIGRDSSIQQLVPQNQTFTVFMLNEADYVTYLSWQNEEAVLDMFERHNIGWILLYKDDDRWERDYNAWLQTVYGLPPRHYLAVPQSKNLTLAYDGRTYRLFKVNSQ
jgi:hypothetical protein